MKLPKSPTLQFSVSGLRGLYPEDINPQNLLAFVTAFSETLPPGEVALARDNRPSGEILEALSIGILTALGRHVHVLGIVPTPSLKAYTRKKKLAGAIMISASHNPLPYNALKFIGPGGFFFNEEQNQAWLRTLEKKPSYARAPAIGKVRHVSLEEVADLHIEEILKALPCRLEGGMRLALDPVCATLRRLGPYFLEKLGYECVLINHEDKSDFPRAPEPSPHALAELAKITKKKDCVAGFGFDPDGDRLALASQEGVVLSEELTLPLVLRSALPKRPGAVVINLSTSWVSESVAQSFRRKVYRTKVGEAHVVRQMQEVKAAMGGEGNGGVIDPKVASYGRDALTAMAHILCLIQETKKTPYALSQEFPQLFMQKLSLKKETQGSMKKIISALEKAFPHFQKNQEDGLRLSHSSGVPWLHIRASNTEPIIRVIVEAQDERELKNILDFIQNIR
ncbi:MAG: phosphoglucosamine mutase [Leptospiraceae bacterium]|nr:phosphoglucosamine mutase [Leptospiraceae bacterium]MDW8305863.1 phosphoglucosamine mutase [Leptospiraceae bacterium]